MLFVLFRWPYKRNQFGLARSAGKTEWQGRIALPAKITA